MKHYWQYMDELSGDEVYTRLMHGLFADKLPPLFTMKQFLASWPRSTVKKEKVPNECSLPIVYDSMRNTNEPRRFGIPDPFLYEHLCSFVQDHWGEFKKHFKQYTANQTHKVSQLHIRRLKDSPVAFKMSYHNGDRVEDVIPLLKINANYQVKTDIAKFFPSIYSHALSWAWTTKEASKCNRKNKNDTQQQVGDAIDTLVRRLRDNETCGILIGPHMSNLLSEMLMVRVDDVLCKKGYKYIRNIDDILCFVETHEQAEKFLSELKDALGKYNLSINYSKTKISKLPLPVNESWTQELQSALAELPDHDIGRPRLVSFLDKVINLWRREDNGAVVSYAMKALTRRVMTEPARLYYVNTMLHLANQISYLYPYLDECVFEAFDVEDQEIRDLTERMMAHGFAVRNFEAVAYGFYFAIRYGFLVDESHIDNALESNDCVLKVLAWHYSRTMGVKKGEAFRRDAQELIKETRTFQSNWLYCYEVLEESELESKFKKLKANGVSFLKNVEELRPFHTPNFEAYPIVWSARISSDASENGDPWRTLLKEAVADGNKRFGRLECEYLECIVANLICCSRLRRNVKIPRSEYKYQGLPPFSKDGDAHNVQALKCVLRWLKENHLIGERRGTAEKGVSTFWPKEALLKRMSFLNLSRITRWDESPCVVLKDPQKHIVQPTPVSEVAEHYRGRLSLVNDLYAQHQFSCLLTGMPFCDEFSPRLKAVFNNSSWEQGGRLYASATTRGYNYQCIPSDLRKYIKIDGEETVEVDFRAMHPSMLYAIKSITWKGDYYDFLPPVDRSLAKFATLVILNAKSKASALEALKCRCNELKCANGLSEKKRRLKEAMLRYANIGEVLAKASERHKRIRGCFYRGVGLRLQNKESQIALEIISSFAEEGIPVLPVHDSFIIAARYKSKLMKRMREAFGRAFPGATIQIK